MSGWGKMMGLMGRKGKSDSGNSLPRPKDILPAIGRDLVTGFKIDPDTVWRLKSATKPLLEEKKIHLFRVFSPLQAERKGVKVVNYDSLNDHPELILYSGKVSLRNHDVEFDSTGPKSNRKAA